MMRIISDTQGEKSRTAKLTNAQAVDIVQQRANGVTEEVLAAKYKVSVKTIQAVYRGERFRAATLALRLSLKGKSRG